MTEQAVTTSRVLQHLVQTGLVGEGVVRQALAHQREVGGEVLDALIEVSGLDEDALAHSLAAFHSLPLVNLTRVRVSKQALRRATGDFARRHQILPFGIDSATADLLVAISDPTQVAAVDALRFRSGQNVRTYVAPRSQLFEAIEFYYYGGVGADAPLSTPPQTTTTTTRQQVLHAPSETARREVPAATDSGGIADLDKQLEDYLVSPITDDSASRAHGPGTEELSGVSDGGPALESPRVESGRGSAILRERPSGRQRATGQGVLGPLNPFAQRADAASAEEAQKRIAKLEETLQKLEQALHYEMAVSQALAEILVENGLISSDQLKSRLRRG